LSVFNQSRSNVIKLIFLAAIGVIVVRLFMLQVVSGKYSQLAKDNAIYAKRKYPGRGIIFDRHGKAILNNTTMYDLMVTPAEMKNVDTSYLCDVLGIDAAEFRERIINSIIKNGRFRPSVFQPLLTTAQHARLEEGKYRFASGFDLIERPVRIYPFSAAANVLGYLGEVDSNFLKKHKDEGYQIGDYTGIDGLEKSYEKVLMGQRGVEYLIKDNFNRIKGPYENGSFDTPAVAGRNLHLSLDIELQKMGEKLMNNKIGSIVAIDPATGGILAMVSSPTYDPNYLTGADRRRHYAELLLDPRTPLFNRTVQAKYSPGSTFKTLVGLVGLNEGVITTSTAFTCPGGYYGCGRRMGCHANGTYSLRGAITYSCNAYFANVFRRTIDQQGRYPGIDSALNRWAFYMNQFGLGRKLGVDLPSEKAGNIPTAKTYNKVFGDGRWNSCSMVSVSIGQGEVDATMIQVANEMAYLANKGWYYTPHMVDSIQGGDPGKVLERFRKKNIPITVADSIFEAVHDGMQGVMEEGTARAAKVPGITVCGKTGTVENAIRGVKQKDHAFFAAFAPRENPRIAIAVICENAGFGATSAAPIASLMIEQYLKDSVTDKRRKAQIESIAKMNLIPPRIYAELRRQDSARHARDTAYLIEKGFIKIMKDSLGLEDIEELGDLKVKDKKKLEEEAKMKAEAERKKKQQPEKQPADDDKQKPGAILPDNRRKTEPDTLKQR
jgi:penicillin-binding protein 2